MSISTVMVLCAFDSTKMKNVHTFFFLRSIDRDHNELARFNGSFTLADVPAEA